MQQPGHCTHEKHPRQVPAHRRRGLLVLMRIKPLGERCRRLPNESRRYDDIEKLARGFRQNRPVAKCKIRKTKVGKSTAFDNRLRGQASNGVITVTACEFVKEMRRV